MLLFTVCVAGRSLGSLCTGWASPRRRASPSWLKSCLRDWSAHLNSILCKKRVKIVKIISLNIYYLDVKSTFCFFCYIITMKICIRSQLLVTLSLSLCRVTTLPVGFGRPTRIRLFRLINTQNRALRAPPPSQLRCFSFIHQCA